MSSKSFRERKFVLCTGEIATHEKLAEYHDSHIIGELHHLVRDGIDLTVCAVYTSSYRVNQVLSPPPVIRVYAIGDAIIPCELCDHRRDWGISRTGLFWLMARIYKNFSSNGI